MDLTLRRRNIISGLIALVLVTATMVIGVARSFGAFDSTYLLKALFDTAGQGLQKGSDVKLRGVNIGTVRSVELSGTSALVSMDIQSSQRLPVTSSLTVRPKTLFGEKFVDVDPGADEASSRPNDFYPTKGMVRFEGRTTGGFELERVLSEAYPLLKAIKPSELLNVLDTLARAADGLGPAINRQLVNGRAVADVFAAHDADQRKFLADLNTVASQLGARADDIVALAKSLNTALPSINSRSDDLTQLLVQTARLSNDVADLLQNNTDFITKAFDQGQAVLDELYTQRGQIIPLVSSLASYARWIASVIRIDLPDGSQMAAVKGLLGTQGCLLGLCRGATAPAAGSPTPAGASDPGPAGAPNTLGLPAPAPAANAISSILGYLSTLAAKP